MSIAQRFAIGKKGCEIICYLAPTQPSTSASPPLLWTVCAATAQSPITRQGLGAVYDSIGPISTHFWLDPATLRTPRDKGGMNLDN